MTPVPPSVRVEVGTTAPLDVGVGALAEAGPRLRLGTSVGVMPGPYVDGINAAIALFTPGWGEDEQRLVDDTLRSSLVWQANAGWRPAAGFVVQADSTVVTLGGASTTAALVSALSEASLPPGFEGAELDATATLWLLGGELGWDQAVWRGLHLRGGLGWSFTVASRTTITADRAGFLGDRALDALAVGGAAYLDDTFRRYAHPPTARLALGWAFGPGAPR